MTCSARGKVPTISTSQRSQLRTSRASSLNNAMALGWSPSGLAVVTLNVLDEENLQQTVNEKKPTVSQSSFLLAVADSTPENYHNMSIIFRKLGFPLDNELSQR